jgi:hypothetical protein
MLWAVLADAVVVLHVAFVAFAVLGGLLVLRWPRVAWGHAPAAIWAALVELAGWICPLTPLEQWLRARSGTTAYSGDFIDHYVLPVLYPDWLTRPTQVALGLLVVAINVAVYVVVLGQRRRGPRHPGRRP